MRIEEIAVKDWIVVTIGFPVDELGRIYLLFWVQANKVHLDDDLCVFMQEAHSEEPPSYTESLDELPSYPSESEED